MKKQLLIILIVIILLTGCSNKTIYDSEIVNTINYNLNINDMYEEKIISVLPSNAYDIANNNEEDIEPLESVLLLDNSYPILGNFDIMYNKNIINREKDYKVTLDHIFTETDYINSTFLNACFENKSILQENDYLEIHLSGRTNCYVDKTINIYVTTNYKVLESNGKKDKKTYYWTIDERNNSNVDIYYKVSRDKKNMKKYYSNKNDNNLTVSILCIVVFSIVLTILLIVYKKYKTRM